MPDMSPRLATRSGPVTGRYARALRGLPVRLPLSAWLRLAAGFAIISACGALFAGILDAVLEGDDISRFDQPLTAYLAAHRTGGLTALSRTLTTIGGAAVLIPLTALAAAALAWAGRTWRPLWITALTLAGSQLLVATIKLLVARPRPSAIFAVLTAHGYSFPSGHATSSLAAFGILAWLTNTVMSHRPAQAVVRTIAGLLAAGIGLSRIYLGVHYLSDVLAAWALGAGWLTAVIATLTAASGLRNRPETETPNPGIAEGSTNR